MPETEPFFGRERRRVGGALLISLLVHAALLALQLRNAGPGLPLFHWPWKERQSPVQELNVVLVPAKKPTLATASATAKVPREPTRKSVPKRSPQPGPQVEPAESRGEPRDAVEAEPAIPADPSPAFAQSAPPIAPVQLPSFAAEEIAPAPGPVAADARLVPAPELRDEPPPSPPQPVVLARKDPAPETFVVPKPVIAEVPELSPIPQPDAQALAAAARMAEERAASQAQEEAMRRSQEAFARAQDQAREARRKAEEARRREANRQSQEAEARAQAREQETRRVAEEGAREKAAALESERQAALLAERESAESAARPAARMAAEDSAAARQDVRERGMGESRMTQSAPARAEDPGQSGAPARLADAEKNPAGKPPVGRIAARPVDKPVARLPVAPPDSYCRRAESQFGRPNMLVVTYAAIWRQGIRQNAPFDLLQGAKTGPYENPVVTVSVRSDGSVESVVFNRSSGIVEIDDAVRRIIQMFAPYNAFSRELEMDCDVIEIPSIWSFDRALRLNWRGQ